MDYWNKFTLWTDYCGAKKYSTKDISRYIKYPTVVFAAERDDSFPSQLKKVYDGLISLPPSLKKHIAFTEEEGVEDHCQSGETAITNQISFDWLGEILDNE